MRSVKLTASDKYHLKQRNKIETLFNLLKGQYHLVTSKACSITCFLSGNMHRCVHINWPIEIRIYNKPTIQIMELLA